MAAALAAGVLFCIENAAAYRGYFSDDDLSTLTWTRVIPISEILQGFLSPRFADLRPSGVLYFFTLVHASGLRFVPFLAVLQALHILNACLLFALLRRLEFDSIVAFAGAVFYAFNAVIMDAYWKPMYVYDVLCASFCLVTLLLYIRGHWLIALLPFWLAYKSKELAIMLPVALAAYEMVLAPRREWKRLAPYFLIALSFGIQALVRNAAVPHYNAYSLRFSRNALTETLEFYSSALLFLRYAWMGLLVLPFFFRDRRLYLGMILMAATFVPLLFLPGRMYAVYWYVPLLGLAIAFAALAARVPRWALGLIILVWIPWNWITVRERGRAILEEDGARRSFIAAMFQYARGSPEQQTIVYEDMPPYLETWGIEGAVRLAFGFRTKVIDGASPEAKHLLLGTFAVLRYDPASHSYIFDKRIN